MIYSGNFWELSNEVLNRIESGNYLENKLKHNMYLKGGVQASKFQNHAPEISDPGPPLKQL